MFSTLIMFAVIQGLYILREDEEKDIERKKQRQLQEAAKQRQRQGYSDSRYSNGRRTEIQSKTVKNKEKEIKQQRIR